MHTFYKSRTITQSYLIHDLIAGQRDGNAAVVGDATGVTLITGNVPAVPAGTAIGCKEVSARGNENACVDDEPGGYDSSIIRSANLPASDAHRQIAVVVEFDELIVRAVWPTSAKFADDDWRYRSRRY